MATKKTTIAATAAAPVAQPAKTEAVKAAEEAKAPAAKPAEKTAAKKAPAKKAEAPAQPDRYELADMLRAKFEKKDVSGVNEKIAVEIKAYGDAEYYVYILIEDGKPELNTLREIVLACAGSIECLGALSLRQEHFLRTYYAGRVGFSDL